MSDAASAHPALKPCGFAKGELIDLNAKHFQQPVWSSYFFTNVPGSANLPDGTQKFSPRNDLAVNEVRCGECGKTIGEHAAEAIGEDARLQPVLATITEKFLEITESQREIAESQRRTTSMVLRFGGAFIIPNVSQTQAQHPRDESFARAVFSYYGTQNCIVCAAADVSTRAMGAHILPLNYMSFNMIKMDPNDARNGLPLCRAIEQLHDHFTFALIPTAGTNGDDDEALVVTVWVHPNHHHLEVHPTDGEGGINKTSTLQSKDGKKLLFRNLHMKTIQFARNPPFRRSLLLHWGGCFNRYPRQCRRPDGQLLALCRQDEATKSFISGVLDQMELPQDLPIPSSSPASPQLADSLTAGLKEFAKRALSPVCAKSSQVLPARSHGGSRHEMPSGNFWCQACAKELPKSDKDHRLSAEHLSNAKRKKK